MKGCPLSLHSPIYQATTMFVLKMINARNALFLFPAAILFAGMAGCGKDKDIPDVSNISVNVELKRFDQDLFTLDTNDMAHDLARLEEDYGEFGDIFFRRILGSKDSTIAPEGHEAYVRGFITYPGIRHLYDTCQVVFQNLDNLKNDFEQAFQFYKYYFPLEPLSGEVVTYISEYSIGGFLYGDNSIGVGLDFYLGEGYPYQQYNPSNPNFSQYLTHSFNKDHIVDKSMKLLVKDMNGPSPGNRLLDYMIHNGKELYILDQLLPYAPDSVKLEYSQQQVDWCHENETNIWAYLVSEDLLYSTAWKDFRKLVEYSPNSPGMPDEAPGRTANWLGWQIVKAYMKRHPGTALEDLIALKDAQAIMDGSKYKPRR